MIQSCLSVLLCMHAPIWWRCTLYVWKQITYSKLQRSRCINVYVEANIDVYIITDKFINVYLKLEFPIWSYGAVSGEQILGSGGLNQEFEKSPFTWWYRCLLIIFSWHDLFNVWSDLFHSFTGFLSSRPNSWFSLSALFYPAVSIVSLLFSLSHCQLGDNHDSLLIWCSAIIMIDWWFDIAILSWTNHGNSV